MNQIGQPNYINPNCWVAKAIKAPPNERCKYCTISRYKDCPNFKYLTTTLILIFISLGGVFLVEKESLGSFLKIILFSDFILVVAYGFLFNKITTENIKKNYEAKQKLKVEVREKTKELRGLTENLDKKIRQKTEELQKKVSELERFKQLTVNRELVMVELKKEIQKMKKESEEKDLN